VPLGPHGEPHELARIAVVARPASVRGQVQHHRGRNRHRGIFGLVVGPLRGQGEPFLEVLDRRDGLVIVLELLLEAPQYGVASLGVTDLHRSADQLGNRGRGAIHRVNATPAPQGKSPEPVRRACPSWARELMSSLR
jgi:hypothetical protein